MLVIGFYRRYVSKLKLVAVCRFHPSCSAYAYEAIRLHGARRGTILALKRLAKCQPLHPGGFDPVPPRSAKPGAQLESS